MGHRHCAAPRDGLGAGVRRNRNRDERGATLIEIVIALGIFAIVVGGVTATFYGGLNLTRNNRNRSIAAHLASQEMDLVRSSEFTTLTAQVHSEDVAGVNYQVHRELTWIPRGATNGPCDGTNAHPELLRVHVWVEWADMRGVQPAVSDTVLSPPVGAYDPNTGHIAVKVLDRDAAGSINRVVTATGPTNRTSLTNSDGCAFFAFLNAGSYSVAVQSAGFVDRQGVAGPIQTASVTVGLVSSIQFDYDEAASIAVTLTASAGTIPDAVPLTVGNTQLLPSGRRTIAGVGPARTLTGLFPSPEGYTIWAGSCADADPEGLTIGGTAIWPDAVRDAPAVTEPGVQSTAEVELDAASITVTDSASAPRTNVSVVATHAADQGCASGETYAVGTTDTSGAVAAALPHGVWTISVVGSTPATTWPTVTLDPSVGSASVVVVSQ